MYSGGIVRGPRRPLHRDPESYRIIRRVGQILLGAQISFCGLNGSVTQAAGTQERPAAIQR